jgi:cytochrome c-type biogenesis protein CcmE
MTPRQHRGLKLFLMLFGLSGGLWFVLSVFQESVVYFVSPSELYQKSGGKYRLGGEVDHISFHNHTYSFFIKDGAASIKTTYKGVPPEIFRQKQGVVVEGIWDPPHFIASRLFAKHDETYRPPKDATTKPPFMKKKTNHS